MMLKWRYKVKLGECEFCRAENGYDTIPKAPCFYFVADCRGDEIYICAEHLEIILNEVKEFIVVDEQ